MKLYQGAALTAVLLFSLAGLSQAQGPRATSGQSDPTLALAKLFGKDVAFSATSHVTIKPPSGSASQTLEMKFSAWNGNVRTDMDLGKLASGHSDANALQQMKQMGMDQMVSLFLADKNEGFLIYPGLKAYCSLSSMMGGGKPDTKEPKIDRTELGKETIDGHPCVKSKVTITSTDGKATTATTWEATDLKNIPIQTQTALEDGSEVTTLFKDINQTKPAASLFELPANFTKYDGVQEMMMAAMQRMMGGIGQ